MNYNKNDIEYYVLNKEYRNLTSAELKLIDSEIKTEEEFNSMKQLLVNISAVENIELAPNPELRALLIKDFEQARWKKGIELDETPVVSLEKKEKKRNKVFLWFSMAASVLLLIGLAYNKDLLFTPKKKQLAQHETTIQEETLIKIEESKGDQSEKEAADLNFEKPANTEVTETKKIEEPAYSNTESDEMTELANNNTDGKAVQKDKSTIQKKSKRSEDVNYFEVEMEEVSLAEDEITTAEPMLSKTASIADLEVISEGLIADIDLKDKEVSKKNKSISMENDKDLIGLLYTAL